MGVEITLTLSDEDIKTVRNIRVASTLYVQNYGKKEDSDEGLTEEEEEEYSRWIFRELLFNRMEALIDNELLRAAMHKKQGDIKLTEKLISNINLNADISSHEDVERLHKLCDELLKALNNEQI